VFSFFLHRCLKIVRGDLALQLAVVKNAARAKLGKIVCIIAALSCTHLNCGAVLRYSVLPEYYWCSQQFMER